MVFYGSSYARSISSTLWIGGEGLQACAVWGDVPTDVRSATIRSRY
jgi:hypothetical protein